MAVREKPPNPRENCGYLAALTFRWTSNIFREGNKRDIEEADLAVPLKEHASDFLGQKFWKLWIEETQSGKPSLFQVTVRCFKFEILTYLFVTFIRECLFRVAQPILLGLFISYHKPNQEQLTPLDSYLLVAGMVGCSLINLLIQHPCAMAVSHLGLKYRVAFCSLIYKKSLRLPINSFGDTSVGKIVNLLSNDIRRFDMGTVLLNYAVVSPLQLLIMTFVMWQYIGWSSILGVAILLGMIPLQILLSNKIAAYRYEAAALTDKRIRFINEIISGIKTIKMHVWENQFLARGKIFRLNEIQKIRRSAYLKAVTVSFSMFNSRLALFGTLLLYTVLGNELVAENVFVTVCFYEILKQTMAVWFPQAINNFGELFATFDRLEKFMMQNENDTIKETNTNVVLKVTRRRSSELSEESPLLEKKSNMSMRPMPANDVVDLLAESNKNYCIEVNNVTAKWDSKRTELTLDCVLLRIISKSFVAVIGPVGSGKSSLLHSILKELPIMKGSVHVNGSVSYASQEPWLTAGSIRENIIFGAAWDEKLYEEVVRKCELLHDLGLLPNGDQTIITEGGSSLSGGQRARISLARAAYRRADIYILDDPLSAVDVHVGRNIFDGCLMDLLANKTRILVTHQPQYLSKADHIIMMNAGSVFAQGSYAFLKSANVEFCQIISETANQNHVTGKNNKKLPGKSLTKTNSVLNKTDNSESKNKGTVQSRIYLAYFREMGSMAIIVLLLLATFCQFAASGFDYLTGYWVNLEYMDNNSTNLTFVGLNSTQPPIDNLTESANSNYNYYSLLNFDNFFDQRSNSNSTYNDCGEMNCLNLQITFIFTVTLFLLILLALGRSLLFYHSAMKASLNLHAGMMKAVIFAPMNFFHANPAGRILNRFTQDMGSIDDLLPLVTLDVLQTLTQIIGVIIIVSIINPYILLVIPFVGLSLYKILIYYLTASRSIKRLELTTCSPVFSHISSTLKGLVTIRAFNAQTLEINRFSNLQDTYSTASYYFMGTSRAFALWLDSISVALFVVVTCSFLIPGKNHSPQGDIGVALTQIIGLITMFQWGTRQATVMENQMTNVERVLEYKGIENESSRDVGVVFNHEKWPTLGSLTFNRVCLRYSPSDDPVLQDICFEIKPCQRIGVVGRTGAGKSSIINALFRLAHIKGNIEIDGVDTSRIPLEKLRSSISTIPQESTMFSGTLRSNLDPFDKCTDRDLWKSLEEVEMKDIVATLPKGLLSLVCESGANFSVGQRQLFCLARAILQQNKILVLDEATANVDVNTDALIHETIRRRFSNSTIITIAHRIQTVLSSDKILVIDCGRVEEFDSPAVLLQRRGKFFQMLEQSGQT